MTLQTSVLTTIWLLLTITTIYASPVGECPPVDPVDHTDHLPDDKNCSLFYKCDHAAPVLFVCPDALHFNRKLEVCDWPDSAGCTSGSGAGSTPQPTSVPTASPPGDCPAVGTCPQNEDENSIAKHLPHATNCSQFCKCDHGKPVTFDCPAGLEFNPTLEVCDWPESAGCSGGSGASSPTPAPTSATPTSAPPGDCPAVGTCPQNEDENSIAKHLPHATNCSQFCKCDHGKPVTFDCPAGLQFNPTLEVCDWPDSAGCSSGSGSTGSGSTTAPGSSTASSGDDGTCDAVGTCPVYDENSIVKHLPHRTNCGLYCRCNHGVPITEECPDGLHFNAVLEVCDWPADAGCE